MEVAVDLMRLRCVGVSLLDHSISRKSSIFSQQIGGSAAIDDNGGASTGAGNLFGEITRKGIQTGMGTIAGLGYVRSLSS